MKNIPNLRGSTKLAEHKLRQLIREFYLLTEAALSPSDAQRKGIKFKIKDRRQAEYGFPDYKNRQHNVTSKEYMKAFRKATSTMPSVARSLSFKDND